MARAVSGAKIVFYVLAVVLGLGVLAGTPLPRKLGYTPMTVASGSMEPTIPTGSVVLVDTVDAASIKVGDVITYKSNKTFTTHRVIKLVSTDTGPAFQTQGDANATPDPTPITPDLLEGRVMFHIVGAGYFVQFVGSPVGKLLALIVIGVSYAALSVGDRLKKKGATPEPAPAATASEQPNAKP